MKQESNFNPNNAQDDWDPGDDNPEYIEGYKNNDGVGWGLLQWTFWARKQALLDNADEKGTSVGDLVTQLEVYE